jgi:hypothetical protein
MAYMSQEKKALLAPRIKALLKKYGCKGSVSVRNHSVLVCTISAGPLDFIGNMVEVASTKPGHGGYTGTPPKCLSINPYWLQEHYSGTCREFLMQLRTIMNDGNHDNSDIQTDFFDVGWYIDIDIGKWNKPYLLIK